jgi:hypothetical protein
MGSFRRDLDAKIAAGKIDRSVIEDYLKALPAMNPGAGERGIRAWMRSLPVKGIWQIDHRGCETVPPRNSPSVIRW